MRIINFGSLNIDKVYQVEQFVRPGQTITAKDYAVAAGGFGGICDRCLAHRRGSLGADSRRSTGICAQARINHRKRGKLNLRKECIGMHITIERDGCISCGLCEGTCPSVFRIAEDGLAEVHHQPETAEEQAGAQEAAGGCPVAVIHVS